MGTITKRGNNYSIQYYVGGQKFRESTGSPKKAVAVKLLKLREGEIARGKKPELYYDKISFKELADDYILDYKVNAKKTLAKAERIVRLHLLPFFGNCPASKITTTRVKQYISHRMDQGAANGTINRELAALKRMFNLASRCTPPKVSQVPYIPMLSERNVRQGFFEHDEFLALREALPPYLKGMVTFAYKTGWRLSEITGLTWSQVDLNRAVVRLEAGTTKNDEGRTIFLDMELVDVFKEQFRNRQLGCPYVFHRNGNLIKDFRVVWRRACREADIEGKLFHDLRRTAVRNMVRAGVPERVAMAISGHKTRSVFDRYDIVNLRDLEQAALSVERYLGDSQGTPADATGTKKAHNLMLTQNEGANHEG